MLRPAVDTGKNKATVHILDVLSEIASSDDNGVGITELAARLGMSKNMVFRAVSTLIDENLLIRDGNRPRYRLSYGVLSLKIRQRVDIDLRSVCAPFMQAMHEMTGETVTVAVFADDRAIVIDGVAGNGPMYSRLVPGRVLPLHAGPLGRAILSSLPDPEISAFLRRNPVLPVLTPATITGREALLEDVALTRRQGYAVGIGDHQVDASGVCFPLVDIEGWPHGSIGVGGYREVFETNIAPHIGELLKLVSELNDRTRLYSASPVFHYDSGTPV